MIYVSPVEWFWIGVNVVTLALTSIAHADAMANRDAVRLLNGKAREIAAGGDVRRERFRIVLQVLLLGLVIPSLLNDRDITLNPFLLNLLAIPVVLCISSIADARERRALDAALRSPS